MAHVIDIQPTLFEFCLDEIKKLKDSTFAINGYYVMHDGVERIKALTSHLNLTMKRGNVNLDILEIGRCKNKQINYAT